ncbi:unnamed protein product, partial [Mesorhabditis spiculigera]
MIGRLGSRRFLGSAAQARQLIYSEYGDPAKVVTYREEPLKSSLEDQEVHIKWQAAPINPADINQIQGVYPVKPPMPAVAGSEGFGIVEAIGSAVKTVKVGDHVIPAKSGLGTWRSDAILGETHVFKIDASLAPEYKATLQVNPPTAYRMLKDFVDLKPGDTVIQNGANSAVGQAVIQICRARDLKSVNVIRKRPDEAAQKRLEDELRGLGADVVLTEDRISRDYRNHNDNVRLALNCVGGRSSLLLAMTMSHGGVMVTYGGMSKQPLSIPTSSLIFKDTRFAGFWMSRWYEQAENLEERHAMYKELGDWMKAGKLRHPKIEIKRLSEHANALEKAQIDHSCKQVFAPNA